MTSRDKIYWESDARYKYYKHGPLARTELGENKVQGVDYAYTIQGWLKGVNGTAVGDGSFDMGEDGKAGSPNTLVARDAFAFSLNYFGGDYNKINASPVNFLQGLNNLNLTSSATTAKPLFNGNIASMFVNLPKVGAAQAYAYQYDQLNRITGMDVFKGFNNATNSWTGSPQLSTDYKERVSYDPNGNIITYDRNGALAVSGTAMDNLKYFYDYYDATGRHTYTPGQAGLPVDARLTNQLNHVTDVAGGTYTEDIKTQDPDNYEYDKIGNLIKDDKENITDITWNVYGKISSIQKPLGTINYTYDASGNRISKTYNGKTSFYVRDASGNVMSMYEYGGDNNAGRLTQTESYLYGSSRLGVNYSTTDVTHLYDPQAVVSVTREDKAYELTNHLGNVMATISDRRVAHSTDNVNVDWYDADVITANDYYPFGMGMVGRKYAVNNSYRFGFNGKEKDLDINSGAYDFAARIHDGRIGRWFSRDIIDKAFNSPYIFSGNNPGNYLDPNGQDIIHFYYVNSYYMVDGKRCFPAVFKYSIVEKNNEPNVFIHHKVSLRHNGLGGSASAKSVDTQFYPDIYGQKSGLSTSYGIFNIKDNDRQTLIKFIDEYGLSKRDVNAVDGVNGYTEAKTPTSPESDRMKNSRWWGEVFAEKKFKEAQQEEEDFKNDILLDGILLFGAEFLFEGRSLEGAMKIEKGAFEKLIEHGFRNGRNADILAETDQIAALKTVNLINENQSKLKEGFNYLVTKINGIQKSITVQMESGMIKSMNIFPGISARMTQAKSMANIINLGPITW